MKSSTLMIAFLLCVSFCSMHAQTDSIYDDHSYPILFIGHLNFDCVQDTVVGSHFYEFKYLPKFIVWGRLDSTCCNDTTNYSLRHDSAIVGTTIIHYPKWYNIGGSYSIELFNQDTVYDIIFHLEGHTEDSTGYHEQTRSFVVYGQNDLDTMHYLKLYRIDTMQVEPIYSHNLRKGIDLINPDIKDPSGFICYDVVKPVVNLLPLDFDLEYANSGCHGNNNSGTARAYSIKGASSYSIALKKLYNTSYTRNGAGPFNDLDSGHYYFELRDASSGREKEKHFVIERVPHLVIDVTHTNSGCSGPNTGSIEIDVMSGSAPYHYQWQQFPSYDSCCKYNLAPGTYNVTITDAKGCDTTISKVIQNATPITVSTQTKNSGCDGPMTGWAQVTVNSGTPPYVYSWTELPNVTSNTISGVDSGYYHFFVRDAKGCTYTSSLHIGRCNQLIVTTTVVNAGCGGTNNGSITANVTSGNPPYNYTWSHNPSLHTNVASNLAPGVYTVTVTDAAGCSRPITTTVQNVPPVVFNMNVVKYKDLGGVCRARCCIEHVSGTPPYTYNWGSGPTSSSCHEKSAVPTSFTVTVTDSKGCTATGSQSVGTCTTTNIRIYPNPNNGNFNLEVTLSAASTVKIDIVNQFFQLVYTDNKGMQPPGVNTYPINISTLPNGMYFVTVTINGAPPANAMLLLKQ